MKRRTLGIFCSGALLLAAALWGRAASHSADRAPGPPAHAESGSLAPDAALHRSERTMRIFSALPPSGAAPDAELLAAVKNAVHRYCAGRFEAFFDEQTTLKAFQHGGAPWLAALRDEIGNPGPLEALPAEVPLIEARPAAVTERMAMIDLLDQLAEKDPRAVQMMSDLAEQPFDSSLPMHVKRILAAERYDILFRLVQRDMSRTLDIFATYPAAVQKVLLPSLIAGLESAKVSEEEANRLLAPYRS